MARQKNNNKRFDGALAGADLNFLEQHSHLLVQCQSTGQMHLRRRVCSSRAVHPALLASAAEAAVTDLASVRCVGKQNTPHLRIEVQQLVTHSLQGQVRGEVGACTGRYCR